MKREKTKKCSVCGKVKSFDDFYNSATNKDGKFSMCKECDNKRRNKDKIKQTYGMTMEQRSNMMKKQNNRCAICGKTISFSTARTDHNHDHGGVRGFLCNTCNIQLGRIEINKKDSERFKAFVFRTKRDNLELYKKFLHYLAKDKDRIRKQKAHQTKKLSKR